MAVKDLEHSAARSSSLPGAHSGASKLDWSKAVVGKTTQVAPMFFDPKVVPKLVSDPVVDYAEFLKGNPDDREKFDPSGKTILESIKRDLRWGAKHFYFKKPEKRDFDLRRTIDVDGTRNEYPPPTTRYWQRTLGHHRIVMIATVEVKVNGTERIFRILALVSATPIPNSVNSPPFQQRAPFTIALEHHVLGVPKEEKA